MLVDAIASVILAGMMLIPLVNLIVGIIVGASVAGAAGTVLGVLLALGITAGQTWWWRRLEWPGSPIADPGNEPALEGALAGAVSGGAMALDGPSVEVPTIRTGPALARRALSRGGRADPRPRPQISGGASLRGAR